MNGSNCQSPVVIYVNGSDIPTNAPVMPSRDFAAKTPAIAPGVPANDPYEIAKAFPRRWASYIRANYQSVLHVQTVFQVSERTAYRWWKGEGGAHGSHVAIAMVEHPETAPVMLFAAE